MRIAPVVVLRGRLTPFGLLDALSELSLEGDLGALIFDCREMTDYEPEARELFVRWHRTHRGRIGAVAIVTDRPLWHLVISAMALASGQTMKAFSDLEDARRWVGERAA